MALGWSPPMQPNPVLYQPTENKSPSAWTPASPNIKPVKEFRPVKLDLNSAPKPWKAAGAPQIERTNVSKALFQEAASFPEVIALAKPFFPTILKLNPWKWFIEICQNLAYLNKTCG